MIDYYKLFGVSNTSSSHEIKAAYRILAKKYHPDRFKGEDAEERMKLLNEAKDILLNLQKRFEYDEQLKSFNNFKERQQQEQQEKDARYARERAEREKAVKEAHERAEREKAVKEARERTEREKAVKEAREHAIREAQARLERQKAERAKVLAEAAEKRERKSRQKIEEEYRLLQEKYILKEKSEKKIKSTILYSGIFTLGFLFLVMSFNHFKDSRIRQDGLKNDIDEVIKDKEIFIPSEMENISNNKVKINTKEEEVVNKEEDVVNNKYSDNKVQKKENYELVGNDDIKKKDVLQTGDEYFNKAKITNIAMPKVEKKEQQLNETVVLKNKASPAKSNEVELKLSNDDFM